MEAVSVEGTKQMLDARILRPTAAPQWHEMPGQPRMRVHKIEDGYYLIDPSMPGRAPVKVEFRTVQRIALNKEMLLARMSADIGVRGSSALIANGLWHLGRKMVPGKGLSEVYFVENATIADTLEAAVNRSATKLQCFLIPTAKRSQYGRLESMSQRVVFFADMSVAPDGSRYTADWEEQSEALAYAPPSVAEINLDVRPPVLSVDGKTITLPTDGKGLPSKGSKILDYLFHQSRQSHKTFDLEAAVSVEFEEAFQPHRAKDEVVDTKYLSELRRELAKKQRELAEAETDQSTSESEVAELQTDVAVIERKIEDSLDKRGRPIDLGKVDIEKSRDRVRKALNEVVQHVTSQSKEIGEELKTGLNLGYEVLFTPPQSWGL